ncbi:MAG: Nif3-like dinuclear metal center hexameric protein [Bacteroidetes bacterium]|jgi:dinuclear metal center YbgI/SA1388 family protein|nr:Nif3-like dinuclear metal center hexameric protein [Bacteroidota bacterium]
MPATVQSIITALEAWAPPDAAQSYDNVGLQVGRRQQEVQKALIALDMTPAVLDEAKAAGAELIITHHPLLFQPLKALTTDRYASSLALKLAEAGIALYSIHTNLDAAPGGVSFALAETLGLTDVQFMQGMPDATKKLMVFVPVEHARAVHKAMAEAGAGTIGDYEACAFEAEGTGYFKPGTGADPLIGEAGGGLESAREVKLEMEVPRWHLSAVKKAMVNAHPYEEVAHDIYPVEQPTSTAGLGAVGVLEEPLSLSDFLRQVSMRLVADCLRYAGTPEAKVQRVAVCGGAGAGFVQQALATGADAYVTSDVKYHDYFNVLDTSGTPRMAFIDAGHYETEALTEQLLFRYLSARFEDVTFTTTETKTGPMRTFVGG